MTPYVASQSTVIRMWRAQFVGGLLNGVSGVPVGVQLKVFRRVAGTTEVEVVAEGHVRDPRPELQARFGANYPFFLTEEAVVQFVEDGLRVEPGDVIGVTFAADPLAGAYSIPLANATEDTRLVLRNVQLGERIDLADAFTGTLARLAPAIELLQVREVTIDVKPGSFPNSINLASAGSVPLAILSSEGFDATTVLPFRRRIRLRPRHGHDASGERSQGRRQSRFELPVTVDQRGWTLCRVHVGRQESRF